MGDGVAYFFNIDWLDFRVAITATTIFQTTDWAGAKYWCEQSDPNGDAANQALTLLGRAQALAWDLAPAIQALADALLANGEIDPVAARGLLATAMQQTSENQYDKR